ncbi:MAG: adenosylhomocysteinase, partial [Mycobacteriaceae bacterium]
KFDNRYGTRHSLLDGINRATDMLVGGKSVLVAGYGDVGKGVTEAFKGQGARVKVTEADPINALQAMMDGFSVVTVDEAIGEADIVITSTGNLGIVTFEQMRKMKNHALLGNIGHFDNEIDMASLLHRGDVTRTTIKPQVDEFTFPRSDGSDDLVSIVVLSEGRLLNLGNATGHPSFVMSNSFADQTIAQIELFTNGDKYGNEVYRLPKILDEKVARIHVEALGGTLTTLSKEQAEYIGVDVEGPFKPEHYRY